MAGESKGSGFNIAGLITATIGIIVGISLIEPVTKEATNSINGVTATTPTTVAQVPNGTPLLPTNTNIWVGVETFCLCILIGVWYFYHYVPHVKRKREREKESTNERGE